MTLYFDCRGCGQDCSQSYITYEGYPYHFGCLPKKPNHKLKLRLLGAALAMGLTFAPAQALTIRHDPGGYVSLYIIKKGQLDAKGEQVRIMGRCDSACTIYLGARNVCVGPRARLGFHRATNEPGTRFMVRQWPAGVRAWVMKRGLTKRLIILQGAELRRLVKACK